MYDFVENLCYLEDKEIKKQEIDILRQHILSKLLSSNIISVNSSNYIAKARKKIIANNTECSKCSAHLLYNTCYDDSSLYLIV